MLIVSTQYIYNLHNDIQVLSPYSHQCSLHVHGIRAQLPSSFVEIKYKHGEFPQQKAPGLKILFPLITSSGDLSVFHWSLTFNSCMLHFSNTDITTLELKYGHQCQCTGVFKIPLQRTITLHIIIFNSTLLSYVHHHFPFSHLSQPNAGMGGRIYTVGNKYKN